MVASGPPLPPRIPETVLPAPEQRLYLFSALLLLQAAKLADLVLPSATPPPAPSDLNWTLWKWVVIDLVFVAAGRWLRVPRLAWGWRAMLLVRMALVASDWVMFGRWKFTAAILLPSFLKSLLASSSLSTFERPVRLSKVLGSENSHLGGHYTVHILAVPTAQLNPASVCYCLPSTSSPAPIHIPLILNNTVPSRLTYSLTSLITPPTTKTFTIPASSLVHPSSPKKHSDFDEIDEWALGASSTALRHRLPTTRDPDDPFDLSPTESLYLLPITAVGTVRLVSLLDATGLEVRIRRRRAVGGEEQGVRVLQCPRAGFATQAAEVHSCLNPSLPLSQSVELAVQGYEPLSVSWHSSTERGMKVVRSKSETIAGITDAETETTTTGVLSVPMNVSLVDVGRRTFFLDSVQDGCGNVVEYGESTDDSDVLPRMRARRAFVVHAIPEVMFGGECARGEDIRLLKGGKRSLEIKLSSLERATAPEDNRRTVGVRFTPEDKSKSWERAIVAKSAAASVEATEPGTYEIVSVKGRWCEGVVLAPSSCTVIAQPEPSLATTFDPLLDVCASETGVITTLHLTGSPPFTVTYTMRQLSPVARTREVRKVVSHSRAEIRIEPGPGEWEYRFTKVQDGFYPGLLLDEKDAQYAFKQTVQLVGGAEWKDAAAGKIVHSCDGETVPVQVQLKGTPPWELEYSVVGSPSQLIRDIQSPLHSFDITIPPHITKRGGKFSLSLESVRDGNGCKRPVTAQDLAIDVRRTKPTARFLGVQGARSVVIREEAEAKIPLALTGEGPWTIYYQPPSDSRSSKTKLAPLEYVARQPNVHLSLPNARPGVYTLLNVRDQFCPGDVFDTDWTVSTLPKPTLQLGENAGVVARNGSVIRKAVCENTPDSVTVVFNGKPPFNAPYTLTKGQSEPQSRSLPAIQPRAELTLFTGAGGHHTYDFLGVADSLYTTASPSGLLPPPGSRIVRLEQDVFALPSASFKHGPKRGFCIKDGLASRGPDDLIVQLFGRAPFELELEVREEGHRSSERFTVRDIKAAEWSLELPVTLSAATSHFVAIRRISDANGCSRILDRTATGSGTTVLVTEIASITAVLPQTSHCVGDFLEFVLQGAPPFTVVYEFEGAPHVVPLSSSTFSRVATMPGLFRIVSVGHGEDQCKAKNVDLVKTIHPIPAALVSEGKDVFVDIREGDQTEIIFSFTGTPPFTFTYSRRHPQDRSKDKTVLETHTVTGIMEHSYSIFTSQEGTWSVSYISDAHCSFPSATATGRLENK